MEIKLLLKSNKIRNANCFGIQGERGAVVIDPGIFTDEIYDFLNANAGKERLILITHAHFDHVMGVEELVKRTGVRVAAEGHNVNGDGIMEMHGKSGYYKGWEVYARCDDVLHDGQTLTVGDIEIKVMLTPGHSVGSTCFLIGDNLFSGDTLFHETVGVTVYTGGSEEQMLESIKKLKTLAPSIKVFPGHGEFTTVAHELEFNPYMR